MYAYHSFWDHPKKEKTINRKILWIVLRNTAYKLYLNNLEQFSYQIQMFEWWRHRIHLRITRRKYTDVCPLQHLVIYNKVSTVVQYVSVQFVHVPINLKTSPSCHKEGQINLSRCSTKLLSNSHWMADTSAVGRLVIFKSKTHLWFKNKHEYLLHTQVIKMWEGKHQTR